MRKIDEYKQLIDDLVVIRPSVLVRWVKEKGWPETPENEKINQFLSSLTHDQKEILADIVQQARDGGIHDVLVKLNDKISIDDYRITVNGEELPVEPFGTQLYFDWTCRSEGDDWPEPE
ncbi:DUF6547 family protein [Brevibacillus sp. SYSU BS000544]|uniref:DUF6547 family protein n=1 Tax=Brevibacillus sp. SYSU BS000544 TaxID=3416443 RepID=UPI003CE462CB